jgi:hypothetical protein
MKRIFKIFLVLAVFVIGIVSELQAQFEVSKPKVSNVVKATVDNKTVIRENQELFYYKLGAMKDSTYQSGVFSFPFYTDTVIVNFKAIAKSDTGTAGIELYLYGSFGDGLTPDSIATLSNRVTTEGKISGSVKIPQKHPYYLIQFDRNTTDPKDAKVEITIFPVPSRH